jgi:hypothetical protein
MQHYTAPNFEFNYFRLCRVSMLACLLDMQYQRLPGVQYQLPGEVTDPWWPPTPVLQPGDQHKLIGPTEICSLVLFIIYMV